MITVDEAIIGVVTVLLLVGILSGSLWYRKVTRHEHKHGPIRPGTQNHEKP